MSVLQKVYKGVEKKGGNIGKSFVNLTKEKRLEMDLKEKNKIMIKKKALLKSIREEYIKIKKGDD